jgi:hypothetical protein
MRLWFIITVMKLVGSGKKETVPATQNCKLIFEPFCYFILSKWTLCAEWRLSAPPDQVSMSG